MLETDALYCYGSRLYSMRSNKWDDDHEGT